MTDPPFIDYLLPMLTIASRTDTLTRASATCPLMELVGLTDGFREVRILSGVPKLHSRISWAFSWLKHAGLLRSVSKGTYSITEEGRRVLTLGLTRIDRAFLLQYPSFRKFDSNRTRRAKADHGGPPEQRVKEAESRVPVSSSGGNGPASSAASLPRKASSLTKAALPSSQELFLPVLKAAAELTGKVKPNGKALLRAALPHLAAYRAKAGIPPPDPRSPELPSRVRSAAFRLKAAGLLWGLADAAQDRVTPAGRELLATNPECIDYDCLRRYAAYNDAMARGTARPKLDQAEKELRDKTIEEMASLVLGLNQNGFQRLAGKLARALGSRVAVMSGGQDADEADIRSGMPFVAVTPSDGPTELAQLWEFARTMKKRGDREWILFVAGDIPRETRVLLDGISPRVKADDETKIAELMFDLGIGIKTAPPLELKRIRPDFFRNLTT
jgi:restriction endonuclease Mrr